MSENMEKKEASLNSIVEPTGALVWKSIVTGGIYVPFTLNRFQLASPKTLENAKVNGVLAFVMMCLIGLSGICYMISMGVAGETMTNPFSRVQYYAMPYRGIGAIGILLFLLFGVSRIFVSFKMRDIIMAEAKEAGIDNYQVNSFFLVILDMFYVNYCLNEIKGKK